MRRGHLAAGGTGRRAPRYFRRVLVATAVRGARMDTGAGHAPCAALPGAPQFAASATGTCAGIEALGSKPYSLQAWGVSP
jgi:hypothetical protein